MTPVVPPPPVHLAAFARFLREERLDALTADNLARSRELDIPLLRLFAHIPEDELRAMSRQGMEVFLNDLEAGRAIEVAAASLEAWARDELPGIPRDAVEPSDMVLVYAAQRGALLNQLEHYTQDPGVLMGVVRELDAHYTTIQDDALGVFDRLRRDAAARAARADALEAEVAARTADLAAANEELTSQGEELTAQTEELAAQQRELVAAHQAASKQRRVLEKVIAQAPAGIAYADTDLIVRWSNPELLRLSNRTEAEFVGHHMLTRTTGEARETFQRAVRDVIRTGEPFVARAVPYDVQTPDGPRASWWDFSYVAVPGDDGRTDGVLIFALDVSGRVEAERMQHGQIDQLRQVDRLKDEFLGGLSSQLATPANTVMGLASVLAEGIVGGSLKPEQQVYVDRIVANCRIQLALANDLLDLGRLSAGKLGLVEEPTELVRVADAVVTAMTPLTAQQGQRMITFLPPGLPKVVADAGRIEQVLTTLLFAANKLTPPGGQIRVEVKATDDGRVRCEVQDSGPVLDAAQVEQALERFAQLGGTWLGLSVSRRVLQAMGGDLGVTPIPGTGNAFWFTLPVA